MLKKDKEGGEKEAIILRKDETKEITPRKDRQKNSCRNFLKVILMEAGGQNGRNVVITTKKIRTKVKYNLQ